ncbi:histone deacetylase [Streptacidiphilus sp. PB12-B1b]|uniref:histone deacetylase n=1 Tax=Streptacidiphilus sp. PB12-B1b TaxID=2705012 RepID=UPI00351A9D14
MHAARLACYLSGGRPPGGARTYPGCRDPRPPARTLPVTLPGRLYFALESAVWTGGMAFYDPFDPGTMPARAYLVTVEQFADVAAQEMHREPGGELDLSGVLSGGRAVLGPGRYETLVCPGLLEGRPVLTFTAGCRSAEAELNAPSAGYLRHLSAGLREAHGWGCGAARSTWPGGPVRRACGRRRMWRASAVRRAARVRRASRGVGVSRVRAVLRAGGERGCRAGVEV